jgi:putative ABC transport system permease protein
MDLRYEIIDLIKSALIDFRRSKVRTFLTSLGITIGVLSVVMLIALGIGLKNYIKQQFENLGSNILFVMPGQAFGSDSGGAGLAESFRGVIGGIKFDERDANNLRRISEIEYVVPIFYKSTIIKSESESQFGYIFGTNEDVFAVLNLKPLEGDILTKSDIQKASKDVVLGNVLAEKLFTDAGDAIGKTIRLEDQRYKVVGVLEKKGDPEMDSAVYMSYRTTYGSLNPEKNFFTIYLGVASEKNVPEAKKEAENTLLKRYKKDEFSISEQSQILSMVNTIFSVLNSVLVAIGSISLLVGGIGIMNIMYASVTERTKEIGIRRAVGATDGDILRQFLTESVLLSVFGGILGLSIACLIVIAVHPFFPVAIDLFSIIITFVISSAIGIFFGVFPARRAAKLPPIEAIRYE